jgi:hypothetical protein
MPAPRLRLTNAHPFLAAHQLARRLPFILTGVEPFVFDHNGAPRLNETGGNWDSNRLHEVTLDTSGLNVRETLGKLFQRQNKAYWIAFPVEPRRLDHLPPGSQAVLLYVACPEDGWSRSAYKSRRPPENPPRKRRRRRRRSSNCMISQTT